MKSRFTEAEADRLFSLAIRYRDGKCVRCGATDRLQCAHVIPRNYRSVRWTPANAVTFCQSCHMWQTHHPLEGEDFFKALLGEEVFEKLRADALVFAGKRNFKVLVPQLEALVEGLRGYAVLPTVRQASSADG